jgi:hypothetical protein
MSSVDRVADHRRGPPLDLELREHGARKIDSCGFTFSVRRDDKAASTSERVMRTKAARSRAVFETRRELEPAAPRSSSVGSTSRRGRSCARAPTRASLGGAVVGGVRVAAHAADDPLGEEHPDLLLVLELRMPL